ncbi:MAG: ATP-binding cassette domain-containing protein [Clostridia bacterium]|nr:ATP-binding cassette domain-containing protein [Clostridia bacterium]
MAPQIVAENLGKRYKLYRRKGLLRREAVYKQALDGVSFQLNEGELVGYIGPNGAGKSTTVKILSGILTPDEGRCTVMGVTPWQQRMRHVGHIGVVFGQKSQLWWDLPVRDSFELLKDIYRVPPDDYRASLKQLTELLRLDEIWDTPVRQLSLGQRMRADLAASLLHRPKILFLDEPTIGLDAVTKLTVRNFISQINRERGVTVILTTHDMDDVEALCSRVILIGGGKIMMDGDIGDLRRGHDERIMQCRTQRPLPDALPLPARCAHMNDGRAQLRFSPEQLPAAELIDYLNRNFGLLDVTVDNLPIDEIVARVYGELDGAEVRR